MLAFVQFLFFLLLAFGGTELVGLAAAEAKDPQKSFPKAVKQVMWRIAGIYVLSTLILGIVVPNASEELLGAQGANTKASSFVLAFQIAGGIALPRYSMRSSQYLPYLWLTAAHMALL